MAIQLDSQLEATEAVQLQSASAGDAEEDWSNNAFKDAEGAMQSLAGEEGSSAEEAHVVATQKTAFSSPEAEHAQEQEQSFHEDKQPSVSADKMQIESSNNPAETSLSHPEGA
jgi:hypothetical protein